jgi:two-component system sensor histidine kinase MprB
LAIVKQVVLNHGGSLRVEDTDPSGDPPGTSIFVLLPGRPMPTPAYSAPDGDEDHPPEEHPDKGSEKGPEKGPRKGSAKSAGDSTNSRGSENVISVDS